MAPDRPFNPASFQARQRLTTRFALDDRSYPLSSVDALQELGTTMAMSPQSAAAIHLPTPDLEDLFAGLALVDQARYDATMYVDLNELRVLSALRAAGLDWQEIGSRLGYPQASSKRAAAARYTRLRHRWPAHARELDQRYSPPSGPSDGHPPRP